MLFNQLKKEDKKIVFVYTACSNIEEAKKIGFLAVREKLAISADSWEIDSIYPWQGVIQEISQHMLLLTTQKGLVEELIKYVNDNHSYSTPVIISCDTCLTNTSYAFWVGTTLSGKEKYITQKEAKTRAKEEQEGVYHYGKLK